MFRFSIMMVAVLAASEASAQFAMDMTGPEIRKKEGVLAVEDLAIEETGLVSYPGFCTINGELYTHRKAILDTKPSDYGSNYRLQRKQGNMVVVEIASGSKGPPLAEAIVRTIRFAEDSCEADNLTEDQLFKVRSINGATSATALLKAIEEK